MLPYYTKEVIPINRTIKRGELYYADLGQGVGSEQNGYRPVVIIQNDVGNKHSPTVIVAAVTSKNSAKSKLPTHYEIGHEAGLEAPSIILTEQLRTIDKHRLTTHIGTLTSSQIKGLNHALAISIGLIEPKPSHLTLCLCAKCAENFYGAGNYILKRARPNDGRKEVCSYCNHRPGYEYMLDKKEKV